ncbi:hypothetical protein M4D71_25425 [Niallia taxi]|uniref:O-antigen polymerase n=1 Tax=Niallia taxi TaxID=2499688 RepID=UPI0021A439F0|nr:O-antigen polymerase [Niallia taxi]MCT2347494.1 hypothetical protein [Niallia taxi]
MNLNKSYNLLTYYLLILIILSIYFFFDYFRAFLSLKLLHISAMSFSYINVIGVFSIFILLIFSLISSRFDFKYLYLWMFFTFFTLISLYHVNSNAYTIVIMCFIVPLLIVGIRVDKEVITKLFEKYIYILNILVFVILFLGIIDYISRGYVQSSLINISYFNERFTELVNENVQREIYRYYSLFGHPLRNTQLFLLFFISNTIFNKYFYTKLNSLILSIITILGVTLANSKTGVILALLLIIFFNNSTKKINLKTKLIYWFATVSVLILILNTSFFYETFIQRVNSNSDFTSGRSSILNTILEGYVPPPGLLGNGFNYSYYIRDLSGQGATSFEYPPIMFAYDYGILATLVMYILLLIYPVISFIKKKNYFLLSMFLIFFLDVNSYNGLTNPGDFMLQFSFFIFLLININIHFSKNKEIHIQDKKSNSKL